MARLTNNELIAQNSALSAEVAALQAKLSLARVEYKRVRDELRAVYNATPACDELPHEAQSTERYPLRDFRGRAYRMDGRIKCYAP